MLDPRLLAGRNGHSVVDEPISDGAISRGLLFSRVRSGLILVREIVLIVAAAAAVWTLFRIVTALDTLAAAILLKR